jgi:RimJ/RimL family protein N-acetyltransferase
MPTLRRATEADIPFIHATERLPGYEPLVGRFEADAHRANLADPSWQYLIGLDDSGTPRGFAILQDRLKADGNCFLRRIAVTQAGGGFGKPFLAALIDRVFATTSDTRFWLSVRAGNDRARHVYESLGFVAEGPEGPDDPTSTIMAVTRDAWQAR